MIIAKSFQLDFRTKYNEIIKVNQYEQDGRVFEIQCMSDIVPINLTGATVTFYAKKPDDSIVYNDCVITDALSGKVTYTMTEQTCAADGLLSCWIEIIWSSAVIRSFSFTIEVVTALDETGAIESTSEFTALETALATAAGLDAAAVHKTGNETIAGTKTFSASPVVPDPSANAHAATKYYVDYQKSALSAEITALINQKSARCFIISTRAISASTGTGTQTISLPTGRFSAAPSVIRIRCAMGISLFASFGTWTADGQAVVDRLPSGTSAGNFEALSGKIINMSDATANAFDAYVTNVTKDSFDLVWTRVGAGHTGTVTMQIEAEG